MTAARNREARAHLLARLAQGRILLFDGAMGTEIQKRKFDEAAFRGTRFRDHARDLRVVITHRPRQGNERHGAHQSRNQRRPLPAWLERRSNQQPTEQPEQHRPMPHEDGQIAVIECQTVQAGQLLAAQHAGQWQKMNDAGDQQHDAEDVTHRCVL